MSVTERLYRVGEHTAFFWCPACDKPHGVRVAGPQAWSFNGDQERPTLGPSVLVHTDGAARLTGKTGILVTSPQPGYRCHSFVRDGRIEYCPDCSHAMAGKSVDLPPYPEAYKSSSDDGDA